MAKNDWRSPKGAQPLGTQQVMGKGNGAGATPPPQFPSGSSHAMNASSFGQMPPPMPPGMNPPGMNTAGGPPDTGVQQTQFQQFDPRRPIATNAGDVNKTPANPPSPFGGMPPGTPQGQYEPMSIGPGAANAQPGQVPPDLMRSY